MEDTNTMKPSLEQHKLIQSIILEYFKSFGKHIQCRVKEIIDNEIYIE